jgi:hypothetical protein
MLPIRTDKLGKRCQKPLYPHPAHIDELARHKAYKKTVHSIFHNNTTKGPQTESPQQQHILIAPFPDLVTTPAANTTILSIYNNSEYTNESTRLSTTPVAESTTKSIN